MSKIFMLAMVATTHAMTCDDIKTSYHRGSTNLFNNVTSECCDGDASKDLIVTPKSGACGIMTIIEDFTTADNETARALCQSWNVMAGANLAGAEGSMNDFSGFMAPYTMAKYLRFELYAHENICTCIRDFEDATDATILALEAVFMNTNSTGYLAPVDSTGAYDASLVDKEGNPDLPMISWMSAGMGIQKVLNKWYVSGFADEAAFDSNFKAIAPRFYHFLKTDYKVAGGPQSLGWEVYVKSPGATMGHDNRC